MVVDRIFMFRSNIITHPHHERQGNQIRNVSLKSVHAPSTLVVPTNFQTIQSAIDDANAGDIIQVLRGNYHEQITINKELTLIGSGSDSTIITSPPSLTPRLGKTSIVEIYDAAVVSMTGFTVNGPGGCPNWGIAVIGGASLDLSFTTIGHIHDTSISGCSVDRGTAIIVGLPSENQFGDAKISNVTITDYSSHAIAIMGNNSTARILENSITGYGEPDGIGQVGVLVYGGAAARIRGNRISNNICNDPVDCGPDPVNQAQSVGIFAYNAGAPTEIEDNTVFRNDVGIYLYASNGCRTLSHNTLINNRFFGIVIQNGINTSSHNTINGGAVGEAVVADSSDSIGTFQHDTITETTSSETQEIAYSGFTARAINRR